MFCFLYFSITHQNKAWTVDRKKLKAILHDFIDEISRPIVYKANILIRIANNYLFVLIDTDNFKTINFSFRKKTIIKISVVEKNS
jgi:hypothetical protein